MAAPSTQRVPHMSGVKYLTAIRLPSASSSSRFFTVGTVGSISSVAMASAALCDLLESWAANRGASIRRAQR